MCRIRKEFPNLLYDSESPTYGRSLLHDVRTVLQVRLAYSPNKSTISDAFTLNTYIRLCIKKTGLSHSKFRVLYL